MSHIRILTCPVTGSSSTREQNATLPVTPEEIANECLIAGEEGAAIVHIHVRDPKTGVPSMEFDLYKEVVERIRKGNSDLLINLTTGMGARYDQSDEDPAVLGPKALIKNAKIRTQHVVALKPDICTFDVNTTAFDGTTIVNTPKMCREIATFIKQAGVKPEIECFDTGDVWLARDLIEEGFVEGPPMFQFVLGGRYGGEALPEMMQYMRDRLPPSAIWAAFGIGRMAFPMLATAYVGGGHMRMGMEDTVYVDRGVKTNGNRDLVRKAKRVVEDLGGELATPAQARDILQIKKR